MKKNAPISGQSNGAVDLLRDIAILVVDDNEDVRDVAAEVLSAHGAHVETAIDGADALEKTKTHLYDCILMDIRMPGLDGNATAKMITDRDNHVRDQAIFIALTGGHGTRFQSPYNFPFDAWLFKPIKPYELATCIHQNLSLRRGR